MTDKKAAFLMGLGGTIHLFFAVTCPVVILKLLFILAALFLLRGTVLMLKPAKEKTEVDHSAYLEELADGLLLVINGSAEEQNHKRIYELACQVTQELAQICSEQITEQDFLDAVGSEFLRQKKYKRAVAVFRAGAEYCASSTAQLNLGKLFANGTGVETNLYAAYYWFFKAAENGAEEGSVLRDRVVSRAAETGNPLSNVLYRDIKVPGLRRAMNVGMFFKLLELSCKRGTNGLPCDLKMAEYLQTHKEDLVEAYR